MNEPPFQKLIRFLKQLEQGKIHHTLDSHRNEAIMVQVAVPGERWEIEFLSDGTVEVERFTSTGEIRGESALHELFATHADHQPIDSVGGSYGRANGEVA